jgi:hypothetical protein
MTSTINILKQVVWQTLLFSIIIALLSNQACQDYPVEAIPENREDIKEGSWVTYSPYKWTHDGAPYFSEHCIVYSDGVSAELKEKAGIFADQKFIEVLDLFDFHDKSDLLFPPGYEKVDVYLNRYHEESIAAAYWGCIIITIRSADTDINRYNYLFLHELTHVFQFLIEGKVNLSTDVWFSEGIAIYGGGGLRGITDIDDLDNWISQNAWDPGLGNPIRIHVWDDFPEGADISGYYRNVFDLTMRYFLDPGGLGKTQQHVLSLFYDLRNNINFSHALQNNFGIELADFEARYYDIMRNYLTSIACNSKAQRHIGMETQSNYRKKGLMAKRNIFRLP